MENIVEFPEQKIVEQEALDWMIKLDGDDDLTKAELGKLKSWLARSPAHRDELNNLNKFWQNNVLTELVVPLDNKPSATNIGSFSSLFSWFSEQNVGRTVLACSLVLMVSLSAWLSPDIFSDPRIKSNGTYLTAIGKQKTITLADGTEVYINSDSQIDVSYNEHYRNIRVVQGEAHFAVAKDKNYPFRVYAGDGRVEALGTAFSVELEEQHMDVLVSEGKVAVAALETNHAITSSPENIDQYADSTSKTLGTLVAGQQVNVDLSNPEIESLLNVKNLSAAQVNKAQAWQQGLLIFSGEPLEQVILEVSRFSTVNIEITDDTLKALKIGGRFRIGEVEDLLNSLEQNFGVQVNRLSYSRVQLSLAQTKPLAVIAGE